ncbi:MAG: aconitase X, partial [Trebonia sp.]
MFLTDDEKRMRDGAEGDAVAAAMDLLIRYGAALDADRLCAIRNVAGTMTQPSPVKARLVAEGGWDKAFSVINLDSDLDLTIPSMRVPTCQLQHGFGPDSVDIVPYPSSNVELQSDAESFYGRHGVTILATCTPYQVGNLPMRGEHCAWMESSAVIYANSVLGARTNCEGIASTGAASLTGKIPCWGNHREENRFGTHLISVDGLSVESFQDWGMLGYFAGGVSGEDRPVVVGSMSRPDLTELKHLGAAAATSGGVELYH